jgi:hypothetical protein
MAGEAEIQPGAETPGSGADENLASRPGGASGVLPPPADSASALAVDHDGLRGGKGRADGLTPGSREAASADRLYDCIRHWQDRNPGKIHPQEKSLPAAIRARFDARRKPLPPGEVATPVAAAIRRIRVETVQEPPPLPSAAAAPAAGVAVPPSGDPAALLPAAQSALVAWAGTDIEPLLREFVKLLEEWRDYAREKKLTLAKFTEGEIAEISRDMEWEEGPKKIICESGSRILSKLLNKAGISAEYKDEIFCGMAVLLLTGQEMRWHRKLNKMIADRKNNPAPAPAP